MRSVIIATLGLLAAPVASGEELAGLTAAARSILGADQGVYVETTKGTVLVAQAADKPVDPASVSKVPTALALLRKLGPDHRFVTTFAGSGHDREFPLVGLFRLDGCKLRNRRWNIPHLEKIRADGGTLHRMVLRRRPIGQHD